MTDTAATEPGGADAAALKELVTAAVAGLNPGDREVIELNLRHDLNGGDLADALGVPVNQAHALASRARAQLERSLGALLVARTGRKSCAELDAILAGWDGTLTILLRKRISRHVENCETCGERKRRELSPAMLFSVLPLFTLPRGLRQQVLRLVSDNSPQAVSYRDLVVRRAGRFNSSGFPVQVSPAGRGRGRGRGLRSHPVIYAAAAAMIIIAGGGGGTTAYLLSHHRHLHKQASPTVTVTITAAPSATAVPAVHTAAPSVIPSVTSPTAQPPATSAPPPPSASPSPSPSPGTLSVSPSVLTLAQSALGGPYSGTLAITAVGGPVSYSISVPTAEQAYLTLSPLSQGLRAGEIAVILVTVIPNPNGPPPTFYNTVTIEPGGTTILIKYPPSG